MSRNTVWNAVVYLSVGTTMCVPVFAQKPPRVWSSGTAVERAGVIQGQWVAFLVSESSQGATDLNGDGDTTDFVLHVLDLENATLSNTSLSGTLVQTPWGGLRGPANTLVFLVVESHQGHQDLNEDGDSDDWVLHLYDLESRVATNLKVVAGSHNTLVSRRRLVFSVSEQSQGNEDLNNDGDTLDQVLHTYDLQRGDGRLTNLEISGGVVALSDRFMVYENGQNDCGLYVRDLEVGTERSLELGQPCDREVAAIEGEHLVFTHGLPSVLQVHDLRSGLTQNLGIRPRAIRDSDMEFFVSGSMLVFAANEWANTDLNGDGDLEDYVLIVHDLNTGVTSVPDLPAVESHDIGGFYRWYQVSAGRVLLHPEDGPGITIYDMRTGSRESLDLGTDVFLAEDVVLYTVDNVLRSYDLGTKDTTAFTISAYALEDSYASSRWLSFLVAESREGRDLNGDGDHFDSIQHFAELPRPGPRFLRGDCNADIEVDLADATCVLDWLFVASREPGCLATLNANADDKVDIADSVYLLSFLFGGGPVITAPFPECGPGTLRADGELGCVTAPDCQ